MWPTTEHVATPHIQWVGVDGADGGGEWEAEGERGLLGEMGRGDEERLSEQRKRTEWYFLATTKQRARSVEGWRPAGV